ncbi:MAG TPA: PspC domain-containing protein [Allosphingosinicella sp.]|jgi:phage shock protein C
MTARYALDRSNAKMMGVCSGLARSFDFDPTLVRLGAVASLFLLGPVAILLYFIAGWVAPDA